MSLTIPVSAEEEVRHRLWEVYDEDQKVRGYLFGTIHNTPLSRYSEQSVAILFAVFSGLQEAIDQSHHLVFETAEMFGYEPLKDNNDLFRNCSRGLSSFLTGNEMELARQKLSSENSQFSKESNVDCLNSMLVSLSDQFMLKGVDEDFSVFTGSVDDALLSYGQSKKKTFGVLEWNEVHLMLLSFPEFIQKIRLKRWLLRDESRVLLTHEAQEYEYYRNMILSCYLTDPYCDITEAEKLSLGSRYAPGAYPSLFIYQWVEQYIEKIMVDARNFCFMPTIKSELEKSYKSMFVVGYNHLYGQNGLVNLLLSSGYTVKPVMMKLPKRIKVQE